MERPILILEQRGEFTQQLTGGRNSALRFERVEDPGQLSSRLSVWNPQALIIDLEHPAASAPGFLERIQTQYPQLPVLVLNAQAVLQLLNPKETGELQSNALRMQPSNGSTEGTENSAPAVEAKNSEIEPFRNHEERILLDALEQTRWDVTKAARQLQIGRATLYRKIDRYSLRERKLQAEHQQ